MLSYYVIYYEKLKKPVMQQTEKESLSNVSDKHEHKTRTRTHNSFKSRQISNSHPSTVLI